MGEKKCYSTQIVTTVDGVITNRTQSSVLNGAAFAWETQHRQNKAKQNQATPKFHFRSDLSCTAPAATAPSAEALAPIRRAS